MFICYKQINMNSSEKTKRSEDIAKKCSDSDRHPLDTAGIDTDDEIWIDENSDCEDYIVGVWESLQKKKVKTK